MTIYNGIPGFGWKKGLYYGLIVGLFRVVMMSFSTIVMYNIPLRMVITSLITGYIEIVILCIILAVIYEKLKE
jgi:chromate transport protein ChrA